MRIQSFTTFFATLDLLAKVGSAQMFPTSLPSPSPSAQPSPTPSIQFPTSPPTKAPSSSPTDTAAPSATPSADPTPRLPTFVPTDTFAPSSSPTDTFTPSATPSSAPTDTFSPSSAPTDTFTPSAMPSNKPTDTFAPSSSPTQSPVTIPPVTIPPVTDAPITHPPFTIPPGTDAPVTIPPTTIPPVTIPPVTIPPVTDAPVDPPIFTPTLTDQPVSPVFVPTTTIPPHDDAVCYNYVAEVYPDPHFRTWHNYHYSYHGACDMVFLHNDFLDLHIRTEDRLLWSTPTNAALRIGDQDVVEVTREGEVYHNFVLAPPATLNVVRATHHILQVPEGVIVLFPGGHFILMQAFVRAGVYVRAVFPGFHVYEDGHFFHNTTGMGGTWNKFGLVGRDGKTLFQDVGAFAQEWQVRAEDPVAFRSFSTLTCGQRPVSTADPSDALVKSAEDACAFVREGYNPECVFDIAVTNGNFIALQNPVYIFPLDDIQPARCSAENVTCALLGGTCVFKCNPSATECLPGLCSGLGDAFEVGIIGSSDPTSVNDCSCSVPFESMQPSASPSMMPTATGGDPYCFSGSALVDVDDARGTIEMRDLRLGDNVLVADGRYEQVYTFGHYQAEINAQLLEITFAGEASPLEISPDHMLFTSPQHTVQASSLRAGDTVLKATDSTDAVSHVVKSTRKVTGQGLYAPFTTSGALVVNGVVASCYVGFGQSDSLELFGGISLSYQMLAHLYETPHRIWCKYWSSCRCENYTPHGVSLWQRIPLQMALWMVEQSTLVKSALVGFGLAIILPLRLIEFFLDAYVVIQFVVCCLVVTLAYCKIEATSRLDIALPPY